MNRPAVRERVSREQRKQRTREDLVAAAGRVFLARGFHAASLEEISLAAGYTKGAVYSNFAGGKDELFLAVLDEHIDRRVRAYVAAGLDAGDFEGAVRALARSQVALGRRERLWTALLVEFWTHASQRTALRKAVLERHERQLDALTGLIEELARRHDVSFRLPAREVVRGTGALGRGLGLERLLDPDADLDASFEELFLATTLGLTEGGIR